MDKEEIDNTFVIYDVKVIQKNDLNIADDFYVDDIVIINKNHSKNNLWNLLYLVATMGLGCFLSVLLEPIYKILNDKVNDIKCNFKSLGKDDVKQLEKILKIKRKNLSLFDETFVDSSNDSEK